LLAFVPSSLKIDPVQSGSTVYVPVGGTSAQSRMLPFPLEVSRAPLKVPSPAKMVRPITAAGPRLVVLFELTHNLTLGYDLLT
jgi:hypothetical protein